MAKKNKKWPEYSVVSDMVLYDLIETNRGAVYCLHLKSSAPHHFLSQKKFLVWLQVSQTSIKKTKQNKNLLIPTAHGQWRHRGNIAWLIYVEYQKYDKVDLFFFGLSKWMQQ